MKKNKLLLVSSFYGFTSVLMGAFAAHAFKSKLPSANLAWIHTGVLYQFLHTLALLFLSQQSLNRWQKKGASCFVFGILFFSGSLYTLALTSNHFWGAVTPVGGMLFLIGWVLLAFG